MPRPTSAQPSEVEMQILRTRWHYWFDSRKPAATTGNDGRFRIADLSFAQSLMNDPSPSTVRDMDTDEVEPAANVVAEKRFGSL